VVLYSQKVSHAVAPGVVLEFPALQLPEGVTWLGGGEGRGKTTLLRMLAGEVIHAESGLRMTTPAGAVSFADVPHAYRAEVFWMEPRSTEFDSLTAEQFLKSTQRRYPRWDAAQQANLVEALGLSDHVAKPLYMLSTGSKRKVWLTAAIASGAALTLLDEPFAALDRVSIRCILDVLQDAAQGTRAWVIADYVPPAGVALAHTVDLGE
jgi:ABC-type multidrug transport system ATPase subunit